MQNREERGGERAGRLVEICVVSLCCPVGPRTWGLVMEACASFCHEPSPKTGKFNQSGRITIWRGLWKRMWMQCSQNCIRWRREVGGDSLKGLKLQEIGLLNHSV